MRFLTLFLLLLALPALAQIYSWRDENGVTHYSDKKPSEQQQVEKVTPQANIELSDEKSLWQSFTEWLFGETNKAEKRAPSELPIAPAMVEMYATSWCGYCRKARQYFDDNNIPYMEYDIERDAEARARYDEFRGRGIPIIFVDGHRINGFNPGTIKKRLKQR